MPDAKVTIYHNPRCTKSRQTLQLLKSRGLDPVVIDYLAAPPSSLEVSEIIRQLDTPPQSLLRDKERRELGIPSTVDASTIIETITQHPQIMQRPIVVANGQARLGRPPENVLGIL